MSTAAAVRPEDLLLRLCARRSHEPANEELLNRLLDGPLDWWRVLREAQRHGLLPLIYDVLVRRGLVHRMPPQPRLALAAAARVVAGRSLWLTSELIRIVDALSAEGVPALPFKGPVVAVAAYGDLSLRSFGDLDVLVPLDSLIHARRILAHLGYEPTLVLTPQQEQAYLQSECALQFRHPERGQVVELHWRFSERHASVDLPAAAIWERRSQMKLAGTTVPTLCREDLVLYLSIHGAKHQWERFEWVCCLAEVIRNHPDTDWAVVFGHARRYGVLRILRLGLHLSHSLCGVTLPEAATRRMDCDRVAESLAKWVAGNLFTPPRGGPHYQIRAARYLFILRVRERWIDRLRMLVHSAFKPPHPDAEEWVHLPPRLAFLHHLFRPVRLLGQYGAVAWRYYVR